MVEDNNQPPTPLPDAVDRQPAQSASGSYIAQASGPGATATVTVTQHIHQAAAPFRPGSAPPLPALLVGRDQALRDLRLRLVPTGDRPAPTQVLTAIKG